jgi:hypothetical protein
MQGYIVTYIVRVMPITAREVIGPPIPQLSRRDFTRYLVSISMDKVNRLAIVELYKQQPPPFGHAMHQYFGLDPEYINLNHGTCAYYHLPHLHGIQY